MTLMETIKNNKKKIIIAVIIVVLLAAFFLLGLLASGKDINYIPI